MADAEPLPDREREFPEKQAAAAERERAEVPGKCEHAWASKHEPGHLLYWIRQCMLCHAVDWDDLDAEIGRLAGHGRIVTMTAEQIAQAFHETYERLAPDFGYRTREASAKPWAEVPGQNKALMVAVVQALINSGVILLPPARERSDEDRIREALAEAQDHPGRTVTR